LLDEDDKGAAGGDGGGDGGGDEGGGGRVGNRVVDPLLDRVFGAAAHGLPSTAEPLQPKDESR